MCERSRSFEGERGRKPRSDGSLPLSRGSGTKRVGSLGIGRTDVWMGTCDRIVRVFVLVKERRIRWKGRSKRTNLLSVQEGSDRSTILVRTRFASASPCTPFGSTFHFHAEGTEANPTPASLRTSARRREPSVLFAKTRPGRCRNASLRFATTSFVLASVRTRTSDPAPSTRLERSDREYSHLLRRGWRGRARIREDDR